MFPPMYHLSHYNTSRQQLIMHKKNLNLNLNLFTGVTSPRVCEGLVASFWNRLQKEKSLRDPFGISCLNLLAACCAIICSSVIYLTPSILYVNTTSTHPAGREVDTVLSPQDVRLSSLSSGRWTQPLVLTKAVQSVSNGWLCSYWNRHNAQATCMIIFAFRLHHYFIGLCIYSRGVYTSISVYLNCV